GRVGTRPAAIIGEANRLLRDGGEQAPLPNVGVDSSRTSRMPRLTTRLCGEPGCDQVGVDVAGGWRCAKHYRSGWDKWRESENGRARIGGYGSRWRRLRDE